MTQRPLCCLLVPSGRLGDPYGTDNAQHDGTRDDAPGVGLPEPHRPTPALTGAGVPDAELTDADRGERHLWRALAAVLRARDVDTAHVTFPSPGEHGRAADARQIAARTARVSAAVRTTAPDVVVALSLGARATVDAYAQAGSDVRPAHLVLIGFVTEADEPVGDRVRRVDLLYGAGDLIAYVPAGQHAVDPRKVEVLAPGRYAPGVAGRLSAGGAPEVRTHILDGLGHRLQPVASRESQPEPRPPGRGREDPQGFSPVAVEALAGIILPSP
ncbi:hypothetical protein [Actinacidiphila paucisporea]|uniref:Alpha/beta hydrolase n=1 Tax=Actinacidiphila paucisporea TaxID=310782 RepID=A0A1M7HA98_9ACTN|nr:hypothetical protein [Actinacidiphila paucisporea]SHM25501.1 hypothetical protein SAMN05216499_109212 [Actinacidiphila paucisporea]